MYIIKSLRAVALLKLTSQIFNVKSCHAPSDASTLLAWFSSGNTSQIDKGGGRNERNGPLGCEGARKAEHIEEASTIGRCSGAAEKRNLNRSVLCNLLQDLLGPLVR
jgi:hypothetical protein